MRLRSAAIGAAIAIAWLFPSATFAGVTTITLAPTGDGYLCDAPELCGSSEVNLGSTLDIASTPFVKWQGVVKFPGAPYGGRVISATLALSPYALPVIGDHLDVYGYGSNQGNVNIHDLNAGSFLGVMPFPHTISYNGAGTIDVTSFVRQNKNPYVGFDLNTSDLGIFSLQSIAYHYHNEEQLILTIDTSVPGVPEPDAWALMVIGLGLAGAGMRRHGSFSTARTSGT
jgi:hypothetical protein